MREGCRQMDPYTGISVFWYFGMLAILRMVFWYFGGICGISVLRSIFGVEVGGHLLITVWENLLAFIKAVI